MLEPIAVLPEDINPYLILMVAGFVVGVFGHLYRSRWIVAIGVTMVFLATLLLPLAIHVLEEKPAPPPGPQLEP
jgi:hypothetical protein